MLDQTLENYYRQELSESNTNYFIFDSAGIPHSHEDIDFEKYGYDRRKFNKVKEGDLFIYRRPRRASKNGVFYFFGCGKVGAIQNVRRKKGTLNEINASIKVENPHQFTEYVFGNDIEYYDWEWKKRGKGWGHFFSNYGMNKIPKNDFVFLVSLGISQMDQMQNKDDISLELYLSKKMQQKDYHVPDQYALRKTRGAAQRQFSKTLKEIYSNTCCITGITTKSLLTGAHIIPWSEDKYIRLDPTNGLLLSPLLDKLFDQHLIGIDKKYHLVIGDTINQDDVLSKHLEKFRGRRIYLPRKREYYPHIKYLQKHLAKLK